MLRKKVKAMGKDAMMIGVAGVGLGMIGGISATAAPSIGALSSGLGTAGKLTMIGHGVGILKDAIPKKKRYGGF